jgi:hypothetical protein
MIPSMQARLLPLACLAFPSAALAGQQPAAFEVATIEPSQATDGHTHIYWHPESGDCNASNVSRLT